VSQYQKGKQIWILLKQETVSGRGISWAICKSAPCSRQITTPPHHHSVFTGWMPFSCGRFQPYDCVIIRLLLLTLTLTTFEGELNLLHARPGVISCCLDYCNSLCSASATDYLVACSRCRTLPPAWSKAPVSVTTSHQCYGGCTDCQSVSVLCSRLRGSHISRLLDWLPRTSQTTVAYCRTLAVAHCGPIPMACGSCLCHEHITNAVIGSFSAAGPLLWNDFTCGRDLPSTPSDNL